MFSNGNEAKGLITITEWFLTRLFVELSTEVTLTKRFATTVFSPTQRYNIVATLFRMVTTFFQHWKALEKKVWMIYEINHIWTAEMKWKWRNDRRSELNLCNCVKKPEKNSGLKRGLNPWPRDFTGAMLFQLSYEATDVGSSSIVGSYVPVKEMSVNDIWNKSYMNRGNEMEMKKWSSQWMQFIQLRKEAWKKLKSCVVLKIQVANCLV